MMRGASSALMGAFQGLRISPSTPLRPSIAFPIRLAQIFPLPRPFSSTTLRQSWLEPQLDRRKKKMKGRPRVATGGSVKGTTVMWGDYGLRMKDHHRRISARHLKIAEDAIKQRLRGTKYRLYKRVSCNIGVFVSGNEHRMGKGKGGFDHWASRIALNQILFEIRGMVHEQVIQDAFRIAGALLPGQYEFVRKGDPPCVGTTKLDGITLEDLKNPRKKTLGQAVPLEGATNTIAPAKIPAPP